MKKITYKTMYKLETLNSYEISALQYANHTIHLESKEDIKKFVEKLPTYGKIIDIGCGPGRDAKLFSSFGFEVVGIDFSSKMIDLAKQYANQCSFYVMDIEALEFPLESFDGAWANCSLLHIPQKNILSVLNKIHRILKPKAYFYLSLKQSSIHESFEADARYGGIKKFWSFYHCDELMQLLTQAHFQILDIETLEKNSAYQTHPLIKILAQKQSIDKSEG